MPHLHFLIASGTSQRRLLASELDRLASSGYEVSQRLEGGDWASILTENLSGGLFCDRSVVVVDDAEKLGPFPETRAGLLEGKDAPVVLLLVCRSETHGIVSKQLMERCSVSKASEYAPWARERDEIVRSASAKEGISIAQDARALLKELFEDTGELLGETEKLSFLCRAEGRSNVTLDDVGMFCLSDGSRSLLRLLDGVCNGRFVESLVSLDSLSRAGELLPVVSALHNRVRLAFYIGAYPKEKSVFMKALGTRDYAARQAERAVSLYGRAKLLAFVTGLIGINANEKSGMGGSWRDLWVLLLELMSDLGRA